MCFSLIKARLVIVALNCRALASILKDLLKNVVMQYVFVCPVHVFLDETTDPT